LGCDYCYPTFDTPATGLGKKGRLDKKLCEKETGRLLGAGMVGPNAGDLISEAVLALEMGADAGDISLYRARSRMRKMETQETPKI